MQKMLPRSCRKYYQGRAEKDTKVMQKSYHGHAENVTKVVQSRLPRSCRVGHKGPAKGYHDLSETVTKLV